MPVQFVNEADAPGINRGGVLNVVRHRVEVTLPGGGDPGQDRRRPDRPRHQRFAPHLDDALPEGVKPTIARDFTVATIAAPAGVKEELRAAAEAAAAAAGRCRSRGRPRRVPPAGPRAATPSRKPEGAAKPDGGKK